MRRWALLPVICAVLLSGACEDDVMPPSQGRVTEKSAKAKKRKRPRKDAGAAEMTDGAVAVTPEEFHEADFVESEDSRDPFRNYAKMFLRRAEGQRIVQRRVRAGQFSLEELRLTGIVLRGSRVAMLTDPGGLGHLLRTGEYVGRAEMVKAGGPTGVDVAINWRVDRIRDTDVVFLREDPAHPEIPPVTRVVYLHPVEEGPGARRGPGM